MRTAPLALLVLFAPLGARAQSADPDPSSQQAGLEQRVSQLEQRVSVLEGQPEEQADAQRARASSFDGAVQRLTQIQSALALGQSDVVPAIDEVRSGVDAAASDLSADDLQRTHAVAAIAALADATDAVGRDDLFNARSALDMAALELARARDLARAQ